MKRLVQLLVFLLAPATAVRAADTNGQSWQSILATMPLVEPATELNRSNFARLLLHSFQSNHVIKALVLQPGATDEFYFFNRAKAKLAVESPTMLDAVSALTNQTALRVAYRPPLLQLYANDDVPEPLFTINKTKVAERLERTPFVPRFLVNDHDWGHVQPILSRTLGMKIDPPKDSRRSWHFFRHAMVGWNLNGVEALEAVSLANKTKVTIWETGLFRRRPYLLFEGDVRLPGADREN